MTTLAQTKAIHALRRKIPHYTEGDYRDYLRREFGVVSSKELTSAQAERVRRTLETLAGQNGQVRRAGVTAEGVYAPKLRALWISLHNLGAVENRDDAALIVFVERQTGLSHTRFLTDAADARKAVEALKDWLARECRKYGVDLPVKDQSDGFIETKRAIAMAVAARAVDLGAFSPFTTFEQDWPSQFVEWGFAAGALQTRTYERVTGKEWDAFAARMARRIRARTSKKRRAA